MTRPDHATSPAELDAGHDIDGWYITDTVGGGVWRPTDVAAAAIEAAADPAAKAIDLCWTDPYGSGEWRD